MSGARVTWLVARREINERVRSPAFRYSTLFLLLIVGATAAIGSLYRPHTTYHVAVVAPAPAGLAAALERAAAPLDATVDIQLVGSAAAAREQLTSGRADAAIVLGTDQLLFDRRVNTKLAAIADTAVRSARNHLPPRPELMPATLKPSTGEPSDAEVLVAIIGSMVMLLSLSVYGQWVVVSVVEEKSNRVVELVLSTVAPRFLLAGKVIGIGLLGLGQLALAAAVSVALLAAGLVDAPVALGGSIALVVPWFALGFALYAVAFAAAGALTSRQQDANSAAQPITITLAVAYMAGYAAVTANASGTLANVLTLFPLTSPMVLPARSAVAHVPLWEHALAVALILAAIYGLLRFAGRVYAHGLLLSGAGLKIAAAWRLGRS